MFLKAMNWLNAFVLLIELNILWLLGILAGFFVVGFVPSTVAVLTILNKEDLFTGYYSYIEVLTLFWKNYVSAIRLYKWRVFIFPLVLGILYLELLIVQQSDLMRAFFQWPLLFLFSYVILVLINLSLVTRLSKDKWRRKAVFSLTIPFLLPKESFLCLLMVLTFSIVSMAYHWFFFVAISIFLYSASKCLLSGYSKKGLLKS